MNPYFYSLHMLITGRMNEVKNWTAMDELAEQISDETKPIRPMISKYPEIFKIDAERL